MNSGTTPVTASSFPKWKSNKQRHVIEKSTGKELCFEQDPLSLKWHDITPEIEPLNSKERDTNGNERTSLSRNSSRNEPVTWPEILIKSSRKVKKKKKVLCETSAGSMVDIMSLVKKHLNKSKTSVVNRNDLNCELDGAESPRKNIKTENGMKSKHKSSISTCTSESIDINMKPLQHDHVKIKLEPSSYCAVESNQEASCYNTEENILEPSEHIAGVNEQEQSEMLGNKQEPVNYFREGNKHQFHNSYFDNITEDYSKNDSLGHGIVKIKKEPLDSVELMQTDSQQHMQPESSLNPPTSSTSLNKNVFNSLIQPVSNFHGPCTDITRLKTKRSVKQRKPNECFNEKDTLENSNKSFAVKLELTRIDDIFSFENESSVCFNSPSWTSNNPAKEDMSDSDSPSDKTVILDRKALEFKYQCFSAEPKSKLIKQPDPNVLYNKTKLCRHSNRFRNGETIECGCVRQNYLKCDICGLVLTTSSYTKHVQTHYKIRRYKCPKCTKVYKCTFQFDKHYNQCLKQTKFQCFKCLEVFKRFSFLKCHMASCTVN